MNRTEVKAIASYQALLKLMDEEIQKLTFSQAVFVAYIQKGRVDEAAKYLRKNGMKLPNGNSIQPSHISKTIESKPKDVHSGVVELAQAKLKSNSRAPYWISRF